MIRSSNITARTRGAVGALRTRLRGRTLAILQTAFAAVVAWYLAVLMLPDPRPAFAAIAAVIAVGATHGQRAGRALQLVGGVVLGITVADLLIQVIGTGAWQIGVLVDPRHGRRRRRSAAARCSSSRPACRRSCSSRSTPAPPTGFQPNRIFEGMIGGATALAVSSFFFPPDPALGPGRAAQAMFVELGRALERIAGALETRDSSAAERALVDARAIDPLIRSVEEELGDRARDHALHAAAPPVAPPARPLRAQHPPDRLRRPQHARARPQRRHARARGRATCPRACRAPCATSRTPCGSWPRPTTRRRTPSRAARLAVRAATEAAAIPDTRADVVLVGGQVRSVAVDLVRATELVAGDAERAARRPPHRGAAPRARQPPSGPSRVTGLPGGVPAVRRGWHTIAPWPSSPSLHARCALPPGTPVTAITSRITPLYRSPVVSLGTFWCAPDDVRWKQENFVGEVAHIAFPATPVWIAAQGEDRALAGPNHAMFFNAGDVFRRAPLQRPRRPQPLHGRHATTTMQEWLRAARFPRPVGKLLPRPYMTVRAIARAIAEGADGLAVEERLLELGHATVTGAFGLLEERSVRRRRRTPAGRRGREGAADRPLHRAPHARRARPRDQRLAVPPRPLVPAPHRLHAARVPHPPAPARGARTARRRATRTSP